MADSASKAIIEALVKHMKSNQPSLALVLPDFPGANVKLLYPALTVFSGSPEFTPLDPYELSRNTLANHKQVLRYVVGQYDYKLQLDLWCGNKEERHTEYDRFMKAINNVVKPMGLSLQLEKYHNLWCRFDVVGYTFDDSEAGSQRAEWRVKIDVLAHCKAVLEKEEFIITEPIENNLTTPDNIES